MDGFNNIANTLAQGVGVVDTLGNFNRGAQLAQSTSNIYDTMSAKRALMNAQESGDPYRLGAALKSAQVMSPEYATSVSQAQSAPSITLGRQNQALAEDRAFVAQQALQASPEQRIQLLSQEANELASYGFDPTPVRNLIDLTLSGQHDIVTQQLQAHLAAATKGQQDLTADQREYLYGLENPDFLAYQKNKRGQTIVDPRLKGAPAGTMWIDPSDPSQGVTPIKGTTIKSEVPSEGERKSAVLLKRMEGSLSQLGKALTDAVEAEEDVSKPGIIPSAVRAVGLESVANYMTPRNRQRVDSAQLDILDAALTLGTGAAYTKEQIEGYRKSYFPQIGDDPKTVADKQDRLNNLIESARIAAGRANKQASQIDVSNQLPDGATENDVAAVMKALNLSRDEAIAEMNR